MSGPDLSVLLGSIRLRNPVLAASGTFGYGDEAARFFDTRLLGGIVGKTVTLDPREGNPPPRVHETASGMLNSIGLANPGIDAFLAEKLPAMRKANETVIVNIAGKSVEEFGELAGRLDGAQGVSGIELNLSCPNVTGGLDLAVDPRAAARAVSAARARTGLPIFAKLTPNVTDPVPIARAAAEAGADGISLINTLVGLAVDWRARRPVLGGGTGGLSGPAIKPVALRMVWMVARAVAVPVIGIGGIMSGGDALEFLVAGASAVQVGTASFRDPRASLRVIEEMRELLAREGIGSAAELIGTLKA